MKITVSLEWAPDKSQWFVWVRTEGGASTGFAAQTVEQALSQADAVIKENL